MYSNCIRNIKILKGTAKNNEFILSFHNCLVRFNDNLKITSENATNKVNRVAKNSSRK